MKKYLLVLNAILLAYASFAQKISIKNDTVFSDDSRIAIFKTEQKQPLRYAISALNGSVLITIHSSRRIEIKGKPSFVVTFLNDSKQAFVIRQSDDDRSIVTEIVKNGVIKSNSVSEQAEADFIKKHPLPNGYIDPDQLIEY